VRPRFATSVSVAPTALAGYYATKSHFWSIGPSKIRFADGTSDLVTADVRERGSVCFQQWLGHSDMESTTRHLKPSRRKMVHAKINEIFA
jgi:hypothetical protein